MKMPIHLLQSSACSIVNEYKIDSEEITLHTKFASKFSICKDHHTYYLA